MASSEHVFPHGGYPDMDVRPRQGTHRTLYLERVFHSTGWVSLSYSAEVNLTPSPGTGLQMMIDQTYAPLQTHILPALEVLFLSSLRLSAWPFIPEPKGINHDALAVRRNRDRT